jgi:hypothetical protein
MWQTLRNHYNLRVGKEVLRVYMRTRDPVAVDGRRNRRLRRRTYHSNGPAECWHVDGYDKLKCYGLAISGCIDGFSRRIIWLQCSHTNNDPKVIGSYYIDAVERMMHCPKKVRPDRGSENNVVAALQFCLTGTESSHVFGTSPSNQRIESFWSTLRRCRMQWWIELFEDMVSCSLLDTSCEKHVECIRYCFMDLMQADLDNFSQLWNAHRIRPTAGAVCPAGIPDELYFLPPAGYNNCGYAIDPSNVSQYRRHVTAPQTCSNILFSEYLDYLRQYNNSAVPSCWQEAVCLYITFVNYLS